MKLYSRTLVTWSLHVESNLMTRLAIIFSLLFATTAWADANPDINSETVALMEWLFLALAVGSALLAGFLKVSVFERGRFPPASPRIFGDSCAQL